MIAKVIKKCKDLKWLTYYSYNISLDEYITDSKYLRKKEIYENLSIIYTHEIRQDILSDNKISIDNFINIHIYKN